MKNIFKTLAPALVVAGSLASCSDFLTVDPVDKPVMESFYVTPDALLSSTSTIYAAKTWSNFHMNFQWKLDMINGDMYYTYDQEGQWFFGNYTPINQYINEGWKGLYNVILFCNSIIHDIVPICNGTITEIDKTQALAEARAIRGYCYYMIAEVWHDAPIVENNSETISSGNFDMPRNTQESIYRFAMEDLDFAVANLAANNSDNWRLDVRKARALRAKLGVTMASHTDYAYDRAQFMYIIQPDTMPVNALSALRHAYSPEARANAWKLPEFRYPVMYVPVDTAAMVKAGRITAAEAKAAEAVIPIDMLHNPTAAGEGGLRQNALLSIDMLATSAANGWNRPIYFAMTVPDSYYLGLSPYLRNTGMAYEVSPLRESSGQTGVNTDKMYQNITEKFAWGGLDKVTAPGQIYLDETVRRMVTTVRSSMVDLATALINEAVGAAQALHNDSTEHNLTDAERQRYTDYKNDRYTKARNTLELMCQKLPENAMPFALQIADQTAQLYQRLGAATGNEADTKTALDMLKRQIDRYAKNVVYYQSLSPSQYASLPNLDQYIDRYHFMDLIDDYGYAGGGIEALEKELTLAGVNLQRQVSFRQAIMQQYGSGAEAAPAASDATEPAE